MKKTEIISSEPIIREVVIQELTHCACLTKDEINEYLDILSALDNGELVYNLTTNKGEYLLYVKGDAITNTKEKYKKR